MGMAAILVTWPGIFEQTFVPPSYGVSIWNLSSIGPVVSEEKMFENVDGRTTDAGVTGILIAHLGAFGSGELKRCWSNNGYEYMWPDQGTHDPLLQSID